MYVNDYYGVPAKIGMRVKYNNEFGTIYKDGGNYVSINFDTDKPGICQNVHPIDPSLEYTNEFVELRKLTRSQQRYRDFLDSDCDLSFAEWMGFR